MNHDGLFDAHHAERFQLLIEGLQQWRRRLRVQHGPRVGLESDHSWHGAGGAGPLNYRAHNQLMADMQSIKDAERQNRRPRNICIVSAVK